MSGMLAVAVFLAVATLVLLVAHLLAGRSNQSDPRLEGLRNTAGRLKSGQSQEKFGMSALPKVGAAFLPDTEKAREKLRGRLVQAGLYKRQAAVFFLGVRAVLMVVPAILGFLLGTFGLLPVSHGVLWGAAIGLFGTIAPSFWLDRKKAKRQLEMRRSLPDALDVIVVCLEGGLSLPASFARVGTELRSVHPLLAAEMRILDRETQMGHSTGEAMKQLADRFDLTELRSLASVVIQAEKFGASVNRALRVHAESMRLKRQQRAEELAHKAATKLLFPTILLIMPVLFVVLLGPAAFQIIDVFRNLGIEKP